GALAHVAEVEHLVAVGVHRAGHRADTGHAEQVLGLLEGRLHRHIMPVSRRSMRSRAGERLPGSAPPAGPPPRRPGRGRAPTGPPARRAAAWTATSARDRPFAAEAEERPREVRHGAPAGGEGPLDETPPEAAAALAR